MHREQQVVRVLSRPARGFHDTVQVQRFPERLVQLWAGQKVDARLSCSK